MRKAEDRELGWRATEIRVCQRVRDKDRLVKRHQGEIHKD